ncbi:MAG TPA: HPr kinase/phosphatase C-terminal domain-containing protein, partial [Allosphingosinicella sp.]|nr:HPr kinase/phosphatase C-terminal domain-containing protein [Allosphingosinicella sp.]
MSTPRLSSETVHCSCVAIDGRAVLIGGRSGTGKSDLALRLIDRGAALVSDDYTHVRRVEGRALASAPATIRGKIEMRGVGIIALEALDDAPVCLLVDLDEVPERLPDEER